MKQLTAKVRTAKKLIGEAPYTQYETLAEAVSAEGESRVLEVFNIQWKTLAMNKYRQERTGTPPTKVLRSQAWQELYEAGELTDVLGDLDEINKRVDVKVLELKQAAKDKIAAAGGQVEGENENEEDEEDED